MSTTTADAAARLLIPEDGHDQPIAAAWPAGCRDHARWTLTHEHPDPERRPITMPGIIVLALAAIVALAVLSFTLHFLVSSWLLAAVAIVALVKFWPRRSRR
jgi:hypothetical protein